MSTGKPRLGQLPRTDMLKTTIAMPLELKATLGRYAALHSQAYGERSDAVPLITHMLQALMARDRRRRCWPAGRGISD